MPSNPAETRFRTLVDRLGAIVWEAVPGAERGQASFTYVSGGTEAMLGHPAERWTSDPRFWASIIHPEDREAVLDELRAALRTATAADLEFRMLAADGRTVWVQSILHADRDDDGALVARGVMVDVTERRQADLRLQRLQALTDALSGLLDAREVAAVVAEQGRAAVGADAVAVFIRHGDELEISGYDGYAEESIGEYCRVPLSRDIPAAEAVRTGEWIVLDPAAFDARYPDSTRFRKLAGAGQFVAIPLVVDADVLGALAIRMPGTRPVSRADRVVLDVLARTCAQALQRAAHVEARRATDAVLETVITTAPEGFALFDTELRYVRVNERLAEINGVPAADHVGRTLAEVIPDLPTAETEALLRRVLETGMPVLDVEVHGVTGREPRPRTFLVSYYPVRGADDEVAYLGAFVIDITSRKAAERRASVLAELGSILDEVVSVEDRLNRLVNLLVPRIADVCSVSLLGDRGRLRRVAVRHVDPEAERLMAGISPPVVVAPEVHVMDDLDLETWDGYVIDDAERALLGRIGMRSGVFVPLVVRGRKLGMLKLGSLRPGAFGPPDVALAEEVGRRAALAVDNAHLYESERQARGRTARQYAVAAALADALTPADVAAAILGEVVPAVGATSGTVWQVTEEGTAVELIGASGFAEDLLAGHQRYPLREPRPIADAIRARQPRFFGALEEIDAAYPQFAPGMGASGVQSAAVLPLLSAGRAVGGLWLSSGRRNAFGTDDRALTAALAAQAAQALERARLFEAERRVSVTLQRSLLPARLPQVEGVELAVRYLPAAGLEAGGDFYEALALPDGAVGIAVGDVVGRGAVAAAAMGQLRSAMRAFGLVDDSPGVVLSRLSAYADTVGGAMAATAIFGRLVPGTGELRYACAGHPWPLLLHADGRVEYLKAGRGVPLGCLPDPAYGEATVTLEPGATLLLYTDGLTERRGEDVDAALDRLGTSAAAAVGMPLEELVDRAIAGAGPSAPADDVALVAVRLAPAGVPPLRLRFPAATSEVPGARAATREWLSLAGVDRAQAAELLLAIGEAVANAVEHSGTPDVELELREVEPGAIAAEVRDSGQWRAPVRAEHRGRGFGLMRSLVDDVRIERTDDGTTVLLRRRFAAAPAAETVPATDETGCVVEVEGDVARVLGDVDLVSADDARLAILGALPAVVDLSACTYLDSTGARMLVEVAHALQPPPAVVAPPGGAPRRTLDLSGLADVLDLRDG